MKVLRSRMATSSEGFGLNGDLEIVRFFHPYMYNGRMEQSDWRKCDDYYANDVDSPCAVRVENIE